VVRAENLRFKEEGVKEILKDLFLPWYNAYRFFIQNIRDSSVSDLYQIVNILFTNLCAIFNQ